MASSMVERRRTRIRVSDEIDSLGKRLPELKFEYGHLLNRDEIWDAAQLRSEAMEIFDRIQQLERVQFLDSLELIERNARVPRVDLSEALLERALRSRMGGRAYEAESADGSRCVVAHEGVVPLRRDFRRAG